MADHRQGVESVDAAGQARSVGDTEVGRPGKIRRFPAERPVVTRIETVPMTAARRQEAVFALAELIARWEQAGSPISAPDRTS
jgi:hypothetical protein